MGDFTQSNYGFGEQNGGGMFGDFGLEQLGQMGNIGAGLFGMYNQHQGMQMAKDQLGMQKQAYNDNKTRTDSHLAANRAAFA